MYSWLINDPIGLSVFSFLRNIAYLIVAVAVLRPVMKHLFDGMNKSIGITFQGHVWDELKKGNIAVAVYFGARAFATIIASALLASALLH